LSNNKIITVIAFFLGLAVAAGCARKQADQGRPPVIQKVEFIPAAPAVDQEFKAIVNYANADPEQQITLSFKWYRDGKLLGDYATGVLPGSELLLGSKVWAEVKACNGVKESPWFKTEKLQVGQGGFKFAEIWIEPQEPTKNDTLAARVECANCDGVSFIYRWRVNGNLVEGAEGEEFSVPEHELKAGDEVLLEVAKANSPQDFYASAPVEIISRKLLDAGRRLWYDKEVKTVYFTFKVTDPSGGQINFTLQSPEGAELETGDNNGTASWPVPEGYNGKVQFRVIASSSSGETLKLEGATNISVTRKEVERTIEEGGQ